MLAYVNTRVIRYRVPGPSRGFSVQLSTALFIPVGILIQYRVGGPGGIWTGFIGWKLKHCEFPYRQIKSPATGNPKSSLCGGDLQKSAHSVEGRPSLLWQLSIFGHASFLIRDLPLCSALSQQTKVSTNRAKLRYWCLCPSGPDWSAGLGLSVTRPEAHIQGFGQNKAASTQEGPGGILAYTAKVPGEFIKAHGDWASYAYIAYMSNPLDQRIKVATRLSRVASNQGGRGVSTSV